MSALIVAALSAILLVLIVYAWREHDRVACQRKRAEEADSWAQWWEDVAEEQGRQIKGLRAERDQIRALYTDLVRRRLADNYWIVDRNISGRSRTM